MSESESSPRPRQIGMSLRHSATFSSHSLASPATATAAQSTRVFLTQCTPSWPVCAPELVASERELAPCEAWWVRGCGSAGLPGRWRAERHSTTVAPVATRPAAGVRPSCV
jgi:hypothetical protein